MKFFPSDREELIFAVCISFCLGTTVGLIAALKYENRIDVAASLLAAGVAAYAAFRLSEYRNKKNVEEKNVQASNLAIFNLVSMRNSFLRYRNQFIDPHREDEFRYVMINASVGFDHWRRDFDFDSLNFLFRSSNPNILYELFEVQMESASTIDQIIERNRIHYEVFQAKIGEKGYRQGDNMSEEELARIIGGSHVDSMKSMTDDIILNIDRLIPLIADTINYLYTVSKKMYPKYPHILMKIPNKSSKKDAQTARASS